MISTLLCLLRLFPYLCGGHRQLALENVALHHSARRLQEDGEPAEAAQQRSALLGLAVQHVDRTFLANHVRDLVSIDFFTVPTAGLRVLFVLVVLAHHRRRVLHFDITAHPTAEWTAQQIVEAFPDDTAPYSSGIATTATATGSGPA